MSQATSTLNGTGVMPSLTVDNVEQSLAFYGALGFEVEDRWEKDGVVLGAMLKAGEARLGLSQDDGKKGTGRVKGIGIRIYIEASSDIDAAAARATAAGVSLTKAPYDTEWGTRAFEAVDPSGFALTISSQSQAKP